MEHSSEPQREAHWGPSTLGGAQSVTHSARLSAPESDQHWVGRLTGAVAVWGRESQGSKHTGVCPDDDGVRCAGLSNSTEGVWHVQGMVLRGNWLEGDWWSLPLRTTSYETELDAVLPDEYVQVGRRA